MVKNSVISIISQKENEENRGSVEFQVFSFTTKIRRLTSHLLCYGLALLCRSRGKLGFDEQSTKEAALALTLLWAFIEERARPSLHICRTFFDDVGWVHSGWGTLWANASLGFLNLNAAHLLTTQYMDVTSLLA